MEFSISGADCFTTRPTTHSRIVWVVPALSKFLAAANFAKCWQLILELYNASVCPKICQVLKNLLKFTTAPGTVRTLIPRFMSLSVPKPSDFHHGSQYGSYNQGMAHIEPGFQVGYGKYGIF
ncbi:hypothetical protein HAX54_006840 [Datura stramonium]|uniref:Uncharacterized protein n=1 Tax=Datura stramonium TaxID=4076 RepID=A0ABS8WX12_DATST|nr:hypothetical protein [Datura stramonium]